MTMHRLHRLCGSVALLALLDNAQAQCTPSAQTVDGTRILIGAQKVTSTSTTTEATAVCASICTTNACTTLAGPFGASFMCCNRQWRRMCDGRNDCPATYVNKVWGPNTNGACTADARGANMAACGLDEEKCNGLRGAMKAGAFSQLSVDKTTGAVIKTVDSKVGNIGSTAQFMVGGQVISDYTQTGCLEEPTYESQHTITVTDFAFTPANDSDYVGLTAIDVTFVKPAAAPTNCAYPCRGGGCTSMTSASGSQVCGSITIDTEQAPIITYKAPANFIGSVTFNYQVATTTRPTAAQQPAQTGPLTATATFAAPVCVGQAATYCGAEGACTTEGCKCNSGFTGEQCDKTSSKMGKFTRGWGGATALVFALVGGVGLGAFCFYTNKSNMFTVQEEEKEQLAAPPGVPEHHRSAVNLVAMEAPPIQQHHVRSTTPTKRPALPPAVGAGTAL